MVPPTVRRIRRERRRFACRKRSGCGNEIGERCVWGRCKDTLVDAGGLARSWPDVRRKTSKWLRLPTEGSPAGEGWRRGGRNLCYRHSRMSVRFEAWFATRDRAAKSSEGWRERGAKVDLVSGSWDDPAFSKGSDTRVVAGSRELGLRRARERYYCPSFVSWLSNLCSPAGSSAGQQQRPAEK